MQRNDEIDLTRVDELSREILNMVTVLAMAEVPNADNKAKALYTMVAAMVRPMQATTALVGWPEGFSDNDNRDHLTMYDYINDVSKTFSALLLARISTENNDATTVNCGPHILLTALDQTIMIHGEERVRRNLDPGIIDAIESFRRMSLEEKLFLSTQPSNNRLM